MLTFFTLFVLGLSGFSHAAAIEQDSKTVGIHLMVPVSQTPEEYLQSIIDYWTPERMASAIPKNLIIPDENKLPYLNNRPQAAAATTATTVLTSSKLLPGMVTTQALVAGKAFFVMDGSNYLCSGSVVNATNRDTVITAAHCVFDYDQKTWASNWIFVPNYSNNLRPLGTFVWRTVATLNGWINYRSYDYDVGLVLMNVNQNGQHIQDVAGGLGITLDSPRNGTTTSFGYPVNIKNGETVSNCVGNPLSPLYSDFTGLQLSCNMTGGSSGGPWIQEYDVNVPKGQQVSVNSFIIFNQPNYLFGPYFTDNNIGSLYRAYQNL